MHGTDGSFAVTDNGTLAFHIIGNGDYRFTNIKFEEARAIIDMKGEADVGAGVR